MKRYVYSCDGLTLLRVEEAEPVCGIDCCDICGDCLVCYGEDGCWANNGRHMWVIYEEDNEEA